MTKLEQAAMAIAVYWLEHGFDPSVASDGAARAVIETLREPTKEMVRTVMMDQMDDGPEAIWRCMIDAILNEKP